MMKGEILRLTKKNNWLQGVYRSPKAQKLNSFKSSWELHFYEFLDECTHVYKWESEIVKIPYYFKLKWRNYLPDVLINGNYLIEIKPANQIAYPMNQAKFKAAKEYCLKKGWTFNIITKEHLANKIYLTEQILKH